MAGSMVNKPKLQKKKTSLAKERFVFFFLMTCIFFTICSFYNGKSIVLKEYFDKLITEILESIKSFFSLKEKVR